jgi:NTP pyrophosphatase (non-canonical NTP hydrolase)
MNDDEAREMLEGGPGRPAGHVADIPEGMGPFAFGSPWSGLAKLAEEMGELQKVIGKLMATGGHPAHWQGDLTSRLEEEMGDVRAALDHTMAYAQRLSRSRKRIMDRRDIKVGLFAKWHDEGKRNRDEADRAWVGEP